MTTLETQVWAAVYARVYDEGAKRILQNSRLKNDPPTGTETELAWINEVATATRRADAAVMDLRERVKTIGCLHYDPDLEAERLEE